MRILVRGNPPSPRRRRHNRMVLWIRIAVLLAAVGLGLAFVIFANRRSKRVRAVDLFDSTATSSYVLLSGV